MTYMIWIYEGNDIGSRPTAEMAGLYSENHEVGLERPPEKPVVSDVDALVMTAAPWEGIYPFRCALSPRMEILHCENNHWTSDYDNEPTVQALVAHWEANQ